MKCKLCDKKIEANEKHTIWITNEGGKETERVEWHFACFIEWRDKSIYNRAMKAYEESIAAILPGGTEMAKTLIHNAEQAIATGKIRGVRAS